MTIIILIAIASLLCGCGGMNLPEFESLSTRSPRVVSVEPEDGSNVDPDVDVTVGFSVPIDSTTVGNNSLIVAKIEGGDLNDGRIEEMIEEGVDAVDGTYTFEDDGMSVAFDARQPYEAGSSYLVVVTGDVMSTDMLPLVQYPSRASFPFVSRFSVVGGGGTYDEGLPPGAGGGSEGNAARNRPESLVINEVLYDASGSDTDGDVFIELSGSAGGDITSYALNLVNGDDGIIKDTIELPEGAIIPEDGIFLIADAKTGQTGVSNVAGADFIDNFDPQNGPDCIQLVGDGGALIDAVGYGGPIVDVAENGLACFEGVSTGKALSGRSISRAGGVDSDDNSRDFHVSDVPTPGVM